MMSLLINLLRKVEAELETRRVGFAPVAALNQQALPRGVRFVRLWIGDHSVNQVNDVIRVVRKRLVMRHHHHC